MNQNSYLWSAMKCWMLLKLGLVNILNLKFSPDTDICLRFLSWCLVEILKMKFDQDLCLNLWYDFKNSLWQDELNPRIRCALGNVWKLSLPLYVRKSWFLLFFIVFLFLFKMSLPLFDLRPRPPSDYFSCRPFRWLPDFFNRRQHVKTVFVWSWRQ